MKHETALQAMEIKSLTAAEKRKIRTSEQLQHDNHLQQKARAILFEDSVLVDKIKLLTPREYPRGEGLTKYSDRPGFALWRKDGTDYASVYGCGLFQIIE